MTEPGVQVSDGLSLPGQTGREESSAVADRAEVRVPVPLPLTSRHPALSLSLGCPGSALHGGQDTQVTAIRSGQGVHREGSTELVESTHDVCL